MKIFNFLFHRVSEDKSALWPPMTPIRFEHSIQFIQRLFDIQLLEDIVSSPLDVNTRQRIATISFDDGYKDNIEIAKPILDKYGIKASFYVVTESMDTNCPIWTYQLDETLEFYESDVRLPRAKLWIELTKDIAVDNPQTFIRDARILKARIKRLSYEEQKLFLDEFYYLNPKVSGAPRMMNWDDLRRLTEEGHIVGSHTCTHPMLGQIKDEEKIRAELLNSKKIIEKEIGIAPKAISYPIGSYNVLTKKIAKEVGYEMGLAVDGFVYNPKVQDKFSIPRIEIYEENIMKRILRLSGIISCFKSL